MKAFQCTQCLLTFRDRKPTVRYRQPFCSSSCVYANAQADVRKEAAMKHALEVYPEMLAALHDAESFLLNASTRFAFKQWVPVYAAIQRAIANAEKKP